MSEQIINRPNRFAPPPQRHLTLTAQNHLEENRGPVPQPMVPSSPVGSAQFALPAPPHILQEAPTGPIGPNQVPGRQTYEGGAPADPQTAAQLAELLKQNGDLVRALGERDKKHDLQMKQLRFDVQTQLAARDGAPNVSLPPGVDPETPVNAGQLMTVLTKHSLAQEAHNMRQGWDVTPYEEATVLQTNPALQSLAEPRRTAMIREAVSLLRESMPPAPASTEAPVPSGDPNRRPAREVVAAPEIVGARSNGQSDAPGEDELAKAQRQYLEAERLPDPKQRLETRKALYERILKLQGLNSSDVLNRSFVMG